MESVMRILIPGFFIFFGVVTIVKKECTIGNWDEGNWLVVKGRGAVTFGVLDVIIGLYILVSGEIGLSK